MHLLPSGKVFFFQKRKTKTSPNNDSSNWQEIKNHPLFNYMSLTRCKFKKTNITLIGMAGVGKSIVGRELAKRLNCKFLDIDEIIEKKNKLKLQQVVDKFGDNKFLKIEEKAILSLNKLNKLGNDIISPGVSVIYSKKAMKFLKKISIIVFLKTSFKNIKRNLVYPEGRGIVGFKKKSLKTLFSEREILYKKNADVIIGIPEEFNIDVIIRNITKKITF